MPMSDTLETVSYEAAAAAADRVFRKTRRRALVAWSAFAVGMTAMVVVGQLQPDVRRWAGPVAIALVVLGFCGGLFLAMHAYTAWGLRRIYEAGVSLPVPAAIASEHRRSGVLASAFCSTAVLSVALMFVADEHRWLGPIVASLFLVSCAGAMHFLQVWDLTRQLGEICGRDQ
jgi:hypothetical protein